MVLVTGRIGGQEVETADILTYNDEGKLVQFDSLSDEAVANAAYPR